VTDESTLTYLAEVLALDPSEECGRIMELRAQWTARAGTRALPRGSRDAPAVASDDQRAEARAMIESVRKGFWSESDDVIARRLDALEFDEFPDLARMRTRLQCASAARDEMDALGDDPKAAQTLTAVLRRILVVSGPEAARLRNKAVEDAALPYRTGLSREFARRLTMHYPALAALEGDWLARLARARKDKPRSKAVKRFLGCFGYYIVFMLLSRLARFLTDWLQGS